MKLFLPFLKYLKPHRGKLVWAILFGAIFGVSSGAGLPAIFKKVLSAAPGGASSSAVVFLFANGQYFTLQAIDLEHRTYTGFVSDDKGNPLEQTPRVIPAAPGSEVSMDNARVDVANALGTQQYPFRQIALLAMSIPLVFFFRACFGYASGVLSTKVAVEVGTRLQSDVFNKLQEMPLAYFDSNQRGDLQMRLSRDTTIVQAAVLDTAPEIIRQPFIVVAAVGYLIQQALKSHDAGLLLAFLIVTPICLLPVRLLGKKLRKRSREQAAFASNVAQHLWENFNAINEIRAFSLEEVQKRGFEQKLRAFFGAEYKIKKYLLLQQPSMEFVVSLLVGGIIIYTFLRGISLANLLSLGTAIYFGFDPIKRIGQALNRLHQAQPCGERLSEFFALPSSIADPPNPRPLERVRGEIVFDHVTFAYGDKPVLQDINVRIPAGCNCALVGPSGAGKSTFAKLIPRFYEVGSGSLTIDGIEIRDVRQIDLRRQIAVVSQHPVLFDIPLIENIRLGRPSATDEEIFEAARRAHADTFIRAFDQGYQTNAGDRGDRLSGGQKQRLAIARAFLKNAPILLLDEAVSALDSESEQLILDALDALTRDRTVVTIAHRLSTIRGADLILLFDHGHLVAQGRHDDLIQRHPLYKSLCDKQGLTGATLPPFPL